MEKSIYNINKNGLSYGRGYVYSLQYHIVWCTKYRRKVLTAGADRRRKQLLLDLAEEYSSGIPAMGVMPDHVHVYRRGAVLYLRHRGEDREGRPCQAPVPAASGDEGKSSGEGTCGALPTVL